MIIYNTKFFRSKRTVYFNIIRKLHTASHNKAYALHSLAVVRATPNRGEKTAATSHKQDVRRKTAPDFLVENMIW